MEEETYGMTPEQLEEIRKSFKSIDTNGDGRISVSELMRAQQLLGLNPTREETKKMIDECDTDNSGFIELNEYIMLMSERYGALSYEADMMKASFEHFDKDKSGYLDRNQLKDYLTRCGDKLTDEEFNRVIVDMDLDGDGKIDLLEFTMMLTKKQ